MSRVIRNDHLFTPEEVAYLKARSQHQLVEYNASLYGPGGQLEGQADNNDVIELDEDLYNHVVSLSLEKAREELEYMHLPTDGSEADVRRRLAKALQEARDSGPND